MSFRDKFLHSRLARAVYKFKFYTDIGVGQITWVTGKLPELMAVVYLLGKFGYDPSSNQILALSFSVLCCLVLFGYVWKHTGLYDTAQYVIAEKDPVQAELLEAARMIRHDILRRRRQCPGDKVVVKADGSRKFLLCLHPDREGHAGDCVYRDE